MKRPKYFDFSWHRKPVVVLRDLISGIIAAISAVIVYLVPATAGYTAYAIATGITYALVYGAMTVASSLLSSLTMKSGKENTMSTGGIMANTQNVSDPIRVIYGKCRIGGSRVFVHTTDTLNRLVHVIIVWCEGEVEGIETDGIGEMIWLDDKRIQDYVFFGLPLYSHEFHNGSMDQTVSAELQSHFSDWADAKRGKAYSYFRLKYNPGFYTNFPEFTCIMKGRKVFDPRDGSHAYSRNGALIYRDFKTHPRFGGGILGSLVDKQAIIDAANWCDTNGYYFDGGILDRKELLDNLEDILLNLKAEDNWTGGEYKLQIQQYSAAVMPLDENDIQIDPAKCNSLAISTAGIQDVPTRIKAAFYEPIDNYKIRYAYWPQEALQSGESDKPPKEIPLIGTASYEQALKLVKYYWTRARFLNQFSGMAHPRTSALELSDIIQISHNPQKTVRSIPEDWSGKILRVRNISGNQANQVSLTLMDEDPSIYDDTVDIAIHNSYETTLPGQFAPVDPESLTYETGEDASTPNYSDAFIEFQWDHMGDNFDYQLRWRYEGKIVWTMRRIDAPSGDIGLAAKTGTGTINLMTGGEFTGAVQKNYKVQIDGVGSPNTIKWSDDGGATWEETGIALTAAWMNLNNGVKIKPSALTGGVIDDYWTFSTVPKTPVKYREGRIIGNSTVEWQVRAIDGNQKSEWITPADKAVAWGPEGPADVSFVDADCKFDSPNPFVKWTALTVEPQYYELRTENANWGAKDIKHVALLSGKKTVFEWVAYVKWCETQGFNESQKRSVTIYIKARDTLGTYSAAADSIALNNPAPTMSGFSPTVKPVWLGLMVDWSAWTGKTDKDISKYVIYASTQGTTPIEDQYIVVPDVSHLLTKYTVRGLTRGLTYDVRVRPHDIFGAGTASS